VEILEFDDEERARKDGSGHCCGSDISETNLGPLQCVRVFARNWTTSGKMKFLFGKPPIPPILILAKTPYTLLKKKTPLFPTTNLVLEANRGVLSVFPPLVSGGK
jgi:hypothetical protein